MTDKQRRVLKQRRLDRFTHHYLRGVSPLVHDGVFGPATKGRIKLVKFYLGWGKRDSKWTRGFDQRLAHPHSRKYSDRKMLRRAARRRVAERARWRRLRIRASISPGVTTFDRKPCAKWMVPYLRWARAHGWRGQLVSGWRSPAYSESLCYRRCGRPSCPGTCAGRATNHSGSAPPRGALDVSDFYKFGQLMRQCPLRPRIFNALGARDPVHFSVSGRALDPLAVLVLAEAACRLVG